MSSSSSRKAEQAELEAELRLRKAEETRSSILSLKCRYYENKFPDKLDCVLCDVQRVGQMGAEVQLVEFENKEGLVQLSELSRRRIRSIHKIIKPKYQVVLRVNNIDADKGYIDLSKKHVDEDENKAYTAFYAGSSLVHGIVRKVAHDAGVPMLLIYRKVVWPLYRQAPRTDDDDDFSFDPLHGFHRINENPDIIDGIQPALDEDAVAAAGGGGSGAAEADPASAASGAGAGEEEDLREVDWETDPRSLKAMGKELFESIKTKLVAEIRHRLRDQPVKVRASFKLTCFGEEGIMAIKRALVKGQAVVDAARAEGAAASEKEAAEAGKTVEEAGTKDDTTIRMALIAAPDYVITAKCPRKRGDAVLASVTETIAAIRSEIDKAVGGNLQVSEAPAVSNADEEAPAAD